MKVEIERYGGKEPFGIHLVSENEEDMIILRRFFEGGAKVNSIYQDGEKLDITFKDLIGKE